jgi:hypothetical protein
VTKDGLRCRIRREVGIIGTANKVQTRRRGETGEVLVAQISAESKRRDSLECQENPPVVRQCRGRCCNQLEFVLVVRVRTFILSSGIFDVLGSTDSVSRKSAPVVVSTSQG